MKRCFSQNLIAILLLLNGATSFAAAPVLLPEVIKPPQDTAYKNKTYRFSFSIPAGWEKQSGSANADNALFMQTPISNSCSFQFNITPMSASFPAEVAVVTALAAAYHDIKTNKLTSAKRRDTVLREKIKVKKQVEEKLVILTRGWEVTEKAHPQKQQRIIYQLYDRQNRYFNFVAASTSENFSLCSSQLQKIINSVSFEPDSLK